jgi:hypothetical protein
MPLTSINNPNPYLMRINRLLREFTRGQQQVTALEPYRYSQRVLLPCVHPDLPQHRNF